MWKTKILALLLLAVFVVDLGAASDAEDRKAARDARRQERKEKRDARKAKPEEVNLQDVVVEAAPNQDLIPVLEEEVVEDVASNKVAFTEEIVEEPYYEETTTTALAIEPKVTSSDADRNSAAGEQSPEKTEESEEDNTWLLILIIAGGALVSFVSWLNSRRCPKCRKRFAMVAIDENFHGFGKENGKTCNKMKVTRQCKYCGFQDYVVEKRQFDK